MKRDHMILILGWVCMVIIYTSIGYATCNRGDVTGNGKVDIDDVVRLAESIFQGGTPPVPCPEDVVWRSYFWLSDMSTMPDGACLILLKARSPFQTIWVNVIGDSSSTLYNRTVSFENTDDFEIWIIIDSSYISEHDHGFFGEPK